MSTPGAVSKSGAEVPLKKVNGYRYMNQRERFAPLPTESQPRLDSEGVRAAPVLALPDSSPSRGTAGASASGALRIIAQFDLAAARLTRCAFFGGCVFFRNSSKLWGLSPDRLRGGPGQP